MKLSLDIPSPSLSSATMKPPHACSIPHLLDIDPFEDFEFSFPCEEFWWDDLDSDTSDYFSDSNSDYSAPSMIDIDTSFQSEFYSLSPNPFPESDIQEKDVLIQKTISAISHVAPRFIYKRRKAAKKRRRNRRRRKQMTAVLIEPEFRSLWHNCSSVGDLFAPSAASKLPPPLNLPTVNLSTVNKSMLRRLPDVIEAPIHSCADNAQFYTKVVCQHYASKYVSTPTPRTQHQVPNPFGCLPAIETDYGNVPPPNEAVYGYIYSEGKWRVKAEYPRVPDPGGGHGRG